jgi:hypothetical protein
VRRLTVSGVLCTLGEKGSRVKIPRELVAVTKELRFIMPLIFREGETRC